MFFDFEEARWREDVSGQATLPTVLLIGGIMIVIATIGAVVAIVLGNTIYNAKLSAEALAAAQAGAQYGINRIRAGCDLSNGTLINSCCPLASPCTISINSTVSASVSITANNSTSSVVIDSTGSAAAARRKVEAVVGVDKTTGLTSIQSITEIAD